ncbi:MAG: GH3 auxin-responsive promoter family protein [Salibacteraceae bacterium]
MGVKALAAKFLASFEKRGIQQWSNDPIKAQLHTFEWLLKRASTTAFGKDHNLHEQLPQKEWVNHVPLTDYEGLKDYVDRLRNGEQNVLYPGLPDYFCTTSGTTSGAKYIPMTKHGIQAQVKAARSALLSYIHQSGNARFTEGKMIFLQGSPVLEERNGIQTGRLSGIVAHHVPSYVQANRLPSMATNGIEEWETKINAIVDETIDQDLRLISGIPPWVQMYFERLLERSGKNCIADIFPNLSVFAHGGVNFDPYKPTFDKLIGKPIDSLETYPASEGFIAFQDDYTDPGLLLNLDAGIYYEFIPVDEFHNERPTRLSLEEVQTGVNYALVLNTSSGLWGYVIGDTVKFISTKPYRIRVTGRIAHFISAFGEHVIAEEVEGAMTAVCRTLNISVIEFHVAPQVKPSSGLPYHEWFVASDASFPGEFANLLDKELRSRNKYYDDLISGNVLRPLIINHVEKDAFNNYMEKQGKLGGQNKLPRLANDRKIADSL